MAQLIEAWKLFSQFRNPKAKTLPFSVLHRLFVGYVFRDRFDYLNKYSPVDFAPASDAIPVPIETPMGELMDARAQALIATGKPIEVLWSGGVDSTAIVVAFLKNGVDRDKFKVVCNQASINEHPKFYERMKQWGLNVHEVASSAGYVSSARECLLITGRCADQLWGSAIHSRDRSWYNLPWKDGLKLALKQKGIELTSTEQDFAFDVYEGYTRLFPVVVEQFCEFAGLIILMAKWESSSEAFRLFCDNAEARSCVVNFFETDAFQGWAVNHFPNLRNYEPWNPKHYKWQLKDYIFAYDHDIDYHEEKLKVFSLWGVLSDRPAICVHDTDGYHRFEGETHERKEKTLFQRRVLDHYLKEEFK